MLTLYPIPPKENYIFDSPGLFDRICNNYSLNDQFVKDLVYDVDDTEHISGSIFQSPVLGVIPPQQLSGGVKSVLCIYFYTQGYFVYDSTMFGGNCVEWIRRLSFERDFGIVLTHCLEFCTGDTGNPILSKRPICARTEDGRLINVCEEAFDYYVECRKLYRDNRF